MRRYYKCLCEQKITGTAKESERYKLELLMNQAGLTMGPGKWKAGTRPQRGYRRRTGCCH